ncbi:MAG: ABC transporter ATP-binding protein [Thermodesulfobacteriota bacterium]
MIKVNEVTKHFGEVVAVNTVSFGVNAGEAVALLGPNGAGKSTLIKCILGVLDYSGSITLNNIDTKENPKKTKSFIGYVPQEPVFYDMGTSEVLGFFGALRRVNNERIKEVLKLVDLEEHASKPTSALSGGMKQRLSFAIALLSDSPILILDEPTSNLDAHGRGDFLRLVKRLKDKGKTVLFSSHRLDEVEFLADRVLVMKSGRLVLESSPQHLGKSLGLRIKVNLVIPQTSLKHALDILAREGFDKIDLNGNGFSIEIGSEERILPFKKLLLEGIPIDDFSIEELSMESIMNEVKQIGDL